MGLDDFDSRLQASFEDAEGDRESVQLVKKLSRKEPEELAVRIVAAIPRQMEELRETAAGGWGVDIADPDALTGTGVESRGLPEDVSLMAHINLYHGLAELLRRLDGYAVELSRAELIVKVCEVGVEVVEMIESSKLHTLQQIRAWAEVHCTEEAAGVARDAEARYLAGHLTTRISMQNGRLRAALDEIRDHKKPARRERYEVLLRELYVLAPGVWADHHRTDLGLSATRTATVKKIEQGVTSAAEETELATFANREALLQKARDAGLTPREYELFEFFIENPTARNADAARALGVAEGTVKSLKNRIKNRIDAV